MPPFCPYPAPPDLVPEGHRLTDALSPRGGQGSLSAVVLETSWLLSIFANIPPSLISGTRMPPGPQGGERHEKAASPGEMARLMGSDSEELWNRAVGPREGLFHCLGSQSTASPGGRERETLHSGNPLQYTCLEKPMDRGAWQATVHGVTKSRTPPHTHTHTRACARTCSLPGPPIEWGLTYLTSAVPCLIDSTGTAGVGCIIIARSQTRNWGSGRHPAGDSSLGA